MSWPGRRSCRRTSGGWTESARRASGWSDRTEKSKFGVDKTGAKAADRGFVGHKAAKLMQRSKSIQRRREEAVEEKKQLLQNLERQEALAVTPLPCRAGARLAEFRDVAGVLRRPHGLPGCHL